MEILIVMVESENHNNLQQMINMANLSGSGRGSISLCCLTQGDHIAFEVQSGLDHIIVCSKEDGNPWDASQAVEVIREIMSVSEYGLVLFEHNQIGTEASTRLAYEMGGEAITNLINVEISGGLLSVTKPIYSSNMNALYRIKSGPCFATIRSGVNFGSKPLLRKQAVIVKKIYKFKDNQNIVYLGSKKAGRNLLGSAKCVVVAGRGVKSAQELRMLMDFAMDIKAETGGSRPLVMNGLLPVERMIGQSGKIIAPDLCIAAGVSGATPLAVGIRQSKKIIAINIDKEAPIFKLADIGIVADYREVLKNLHHVYGCIR